MPPDMIEEQLTLAIIYGYRVQMGQLTKDDVRQLRKAAKQGAIVIARASWPWLTAGTCQKTYYINTGTQEGARPCMT
jgi:hypothetical protein